MAARKISITVPVELHKRMVKWKKAFNYSKVFQRAVTRQLDRKEQFQAGIKRKMNIDEIIMRLQGEKEKLGTDFYQIGQEQGTGFAMSAHYKDLVHCLNLNPEIDFNTDPVLEEYAFGIINDHIQIWDERIQDQWQRGFLDGIKEFWELIKDQL